MGRLVGRQREKAEPERQAIPTTANRHEERHELVRGLNLGAMADTFADLALKAANAGLSYEALLYELAVLERFNPAIQLQVERLRTGAFVEDAVNVGAVGRPGVGKSHLAAAIGHDLIVQGHTVLWATTAALVQRLLAAKRDLRLP
jgi:DNA replication protein DnaC